jgi:hypothetical protein
MSDLSSQPTPIQTIYDMYRGGHLIVNRRYQRKLVWTLTEKQKLIDSILNAYPIPLVLLAERRDQASTKFEILDGLQRLHTIVSLIENSFSIPGDKYFNVDEFTRAKEERELGRFKESDTGEKITRSEVSKIFNYVLSLSIIRNASESIITEVFGRINSYGHRLSDQERRQAGLVSEFSQFVRSMACEIRGDVSFETLPLYQMPEISVDLPMTKYGYSVQAEDVFWVKQGVLRSTDLRDSLDEQVIADLTACIVSENLIERSKEVLDNIYDPSKTESATITAKFASYGGADKIAPEIKYCIETIEKIVTAGNKARSIIFPTKTTNPFPTVFSTIFLAIHELSFKDQLVLADAAGANGALTNLQASLNTGRDALTADMRRKNINVVKGLLRDHFVTGDISQIAFGVRRELDIKNTLNRSQIETPRFEFKQGILRLDANRPTDENVFTKVLQSVCAIANIGPKSSGAVFVGVADKKADAQRIAQLDKIEPSELGSRWVVGIERETKILKITQERYFQLWRDKIASSKLSSKPKGDVLSQLDMCLFQGVHILIIQVPSQNEVSLFDSKAYIRDGDQTVEASPEKILGIAARFATR